LKEAGKVLHRAKSGRLILKVINDVEAKNLLGKFIFDEKGRKIGKIVELIGPVKSPYASVIPLTDRVSKVIERKVFYKEG
jgi:RNA-binding protein